jgi:protocatechuate 3,4-dioxygenase beta subunit
MLRWLVVAIACLAFAAPSPSQTDAPKEPQKPRIQGKVVDAKSGLPIRKVNVQLRGGAGRFSGSPSITTSADGTFAIEDLEPGRYFVILERAGFVQTASSRAQGTFTLQPAQQLTGLVFQMQPAGVISGKIVDLDGDPMAGVSVVASPTGTKAPAAQQNRQGASTTDDRGEYRVADLKPGKYLVMAQPPQIAVPVGKEEKTKGRVVYASTYYPGAVDKSRAVAVQVRGGEEVSANFSAMTSHVYRISGTVSGVPGGAMSQLILFSTTGEVAGGGVQLLGEGNKFEYQDVLPGTYSAMVIVVKGIIEGSGNRPDFQMVQLGPTIDVKADLEGLQLYAEPAGQVRGKFRLDTEEKFDWTQLTVQLSSAAGNTSDGTVTAYATLSFRQMNQNLKVSPDGSFEMKNVPAGNYQVVVGASSDKLRDYYTKSVTVGGKDSADSGFDVHGDIYVDVLISAKGATIEGNVVDSKGQPVAYSEVAVIPNSEHRARPDSYQRASTDEQGHFVVRGLNPGKYVVLAFEELEEDTKQPEFFKAYAGKGEKVELEEGARKSVTAKIIVTEDETP